MPSNAGSHPPIHDLDLALDGLALLGNLAQTQRGRRPPLGGILEFDESEIDPAAAMRFHRGPWQSVVAQLHQCAPAVGLDTNSTVDCPGSRWSRPPLSLARA